MLPMRAVSLKVVPGLSLRPTNATPSLKGGKNVVGKNGTAAMANTAAMPPAATHPRGAASTLVSALAYHALTHACTLVSPWSSPLMLGSR